MQRTLIGILSLLFASFLFAVPASAVDLPQCVGFNVDPNDEHFTLVAQDNLIFEGGTAAKTKTINGNVLVTNPTQFKVGNPDGTGFVKVGPFVRIVGTVTARTIILPSSPTSKIDKCVADFYQSPAGVTATAAAVLAQCTDRSQTFAQFLAANPECVNTNNPGGTLTLSPLESPDPAFADLCGPAPQTDPCTNGKPALKVDLNSPVTPLAPGCYGALTITNGAVLNLAAGTFTFPSVLMGDGSKLLGPASVPPTAIVNVNGVFTTGMGDTISDIKLNIASKTTAEVLKIFNNTTLTNVVVNAPFGKCHLHTGTDLAACSEVCCKVLDVEPIQAECIPETAFCACKEGFKFLNDWQLHPPLDGPITGELQDARTCIPCGPNDFKPDFPTCPAKPI